MSISSVVGGVVIAGCTVAASPYLAGLTQTVPDRGNDSWWRPTSVSGRWIGVTALVGATVGLLAGLAAGWTAALPAFAVLALVVVPLAIIDVEHHRLPDRLVAIAAVGGLGLLVVADLLGHDPGRALRVGAAAASVFAVLGVLTLFARFGFGDTKLGAVLAGYLGWCGWGYVLYGMMAGFLVAGLGVVPLLASGRATMKSAIAFGPVMILGALLVMASRGL